MKPPPPAFSAVRDSSAPSAPRCSPTGSQALRRPRSRSFPRPARGPEPVDAGAAAVDGDAAAALAIVAVHASAAAVTPPNTNRVLNPLITRYPPYLQSVTNKGRGGRRT